MSSIYLLYRNILENSIITVSNENTDFPKWRLHDRDVGKLFKGTASTDHQIIAHQGVGIVNGNMELNANWAAYGTPGVCERSSTEKHGGTYSWKFQNDAASEGMYYSTRFSVVAGKTYQWSAWVKPLNTTSVWVGVTNGDGIGWAYAAAVSGLTLGAWNYISGQYTETITGIYASIAFLTSQAGAATWYVDDVDVTSNYDVDTLIIPAGHNMRQATVDLYWYYGDNGVDWALMVAAWNGTEGQIVKEASGSQNKGYWMLGANNLASILEIPELWMGEKVELADVVELAPSLREGPRGNIERTESLSGRPFLLTRGEDREYRNYSCYIQSSSVKSDLEEFFSHSRGKPFWLKDLDGNWLFMSLVDPNIGPFERVFNDRWRIDLEMIEVLA